MFKRNRLLESDMIMLIRTFHHAHVVRSIQGDQYIYMCLTAEGLRTGNTWLYFCDGRNRSGRGMCQVITATRSVTVMNTILYFYWAGMH